MGFFGSFFGSDQRKDITRANAKAVKAIDQGYNDATGRYDSAYDIYSPYAKDGRAAQTFYNDALGLNGADARGVAQRTITSDPMFTGKLAHDESNALAYLNARGQAGGGAAAAAGQRALYQNYGNWLDRYRDQGRQGFEASGQQAGIRAGQGDMAMGYGATKAGQAINYGNALASSRNIGVNNIMGLLGTAANAYATGMKR